MRAHTGPFPTSTSTIIRAEFSDAIRASSRRSRREALSVIGFLVAVTMLILLALVRAMLG
jgi:hypothetical protein